MSVVQYSISQIHEYKKIDEELASLGVAPWFHVLGLVNTIVTLIIGETTFVFMSNFDPELYLKNIEVGCGIF